MGKGVEVDSMMDIIGIGVGGGAMDTVGSIVNMEAQVGDLRKTRVGDLEIEIVRRRMVVVISTQVNLQGQGIEIQTTVVALDLPAEMVVVAVDIVNRRKNQRLLEKVVLKVPPAQHPPNEGSY